MRSSLRGPLELTQLFLQHLEALLKGHPGLIGFTLPGLCVSGFGLGVDASLGFLMPLRLGISGTGFGILGFGLGVDTALYAVLFPSLDTMKPNWYLSRHA